ncbi:uncharacterized protein PV09_07181 [Verruconis gallopava]|uniref:3'-5' exonuclease domain-containing protein n=1 Tax=Verruconis gallopava TaxID=253628 RepID=A0A0D1YKP7_9PEZI|nr:uncharacterized protein PV09_07181 [Verruconis gallopava]KIW01417.1 hypothetical protein PV09_07181 [Verruconis gallopava]
MGRQRCLSTALGSQAVGWRIRRPRYPFVLHDCGDFCNTYGTISGVTSFRCEQNARQKGRVKLATTPSPCLIRSTRSKQTNQEDGQNFRLQKLRKMPTIRRHSLEEHSGLTELQKQTASHDSTASALEIESDDLRTTVEVDELRSDKWREEVPDVREEARFSMESEDQALIMLIDLFAACRDLALALDQISDELPSLDDLRKRLDAQGLAVLLADKDLERPFHDIRLSVIRFFEDVIRSLGLGGIPDNVLLEDYIAQHPFVKWIADNGYLVKSETIHAIFEYIYRWLEHVLSDENYAYFTQTLGEIRSTTKINSSPHIPGTSFFEELETAPGLASNQLVHNEQVMRIINTILQFFSEGFRWLATKSGWQHGLELEKWLGLAGIRTPRTPAASSHANDSPACATAAFGSAGASDGVNSYDGALESLFTHLSKELETLFASAAELLASLGCPVETWSTNLPRVADQLRTLATLENSAEVKASRARSKGLRIRNTPRGDLAGEGNKLVEVSKLADQSSKDNNIVNMFWARVRVPVQMPVNERNDLSKTEGTDSITPSGEPTEQSFGLTSPSDGLLEDACGFADLPILANSTNFATTGNAFTPTLPKQAAVATAAVQETLSDSDEDEVVYKPLTYQIPEDKMAEALKSPLSSNVAYWSYDKYRSPEGSSVMLHYCKKLETSETVARLFIGKPVIGCDIEWKSSAKDSHGLKSNVSLIQIACEDRIALFHIALHKGDRAEDVLAPTLKEILESTDVLKCGVSILGDFKRLQKHLGIEVSGTFELSHLYKLVHFGNTNPKLVNKRFVSLAIQTQTLLGLPLYKGDERVSDWSQALNMKQCKYAADDAYASYRVYEALREKWFKMDPRPPFPAWAELGMPIQLAPQVSREASEIEDHSMAAADPLDEDVGSVKSELEDFDIGDSASVDTYGENVFDSLTEEQLRKLDNSSTLDHANGSPKRRFSPSRAFDALSQNTVQYPALPIDHEDPERAMVCQADVKKQPQPSVLCKDTAQQSNVQHDVLLDVSTEAEGDVRSIKESKDLAIQATVWAQETQLVRSTETSQKPKNTLTVAALRAYFLWEKEKLDCKKIGTLLRDPPLKTATVAAYVAECLQFGDLEWTDPSRFKALVKELPHQARGRYWRIRQIAAEIPDL